MYKNSLNLLKRGYIWDILRNTIAKTLARTETIKVKYIFHFEIMTKKIG